MSKRKEHFPKTHVEDDEEQLFTDSAQQSLTNKKNELKSKKKVKASNEAHEFKKEINDDDDHIISNGKNQSRSK